jgi:hypothetical protein
MGNKYDELDQGAPMGAAGEVLEHAKSKYDELDHPDAQPIKSQAPYVPDTVAPTMGAIMGGTAAGVGSGGRMLLGAAKDALANQQANALMDKLNIKTLAPASPDQAGSDNAAGAWGRKTGYGVGTGSTADQSQAYNRLASAKNSIMAGLEKKFGVKKPGESPDLVQRMLDRANARDAINADAAQKAREAAFWESPTGQKLQALSEIGKPAINFLGEVSRGAMNGANIASQINQGINAMNEGNSKTAAAHGVAGGLSAADLLTGVAPTLTSTGTPMRAALRSATGPLAMLATSAAEGAEDVNKGNYGALPSTALMGTAGLLGGPIGLTGAGSIYAMKHLTHPVAPEDYANSSLDYGANQGIMGP